MTTALTDVLIDLSDPKRLNDFEADPEGFLATINLPAAEKKALLARDAKKIYFFAKAIEVADERQQFNRYSDLGLDSLTISELHLEIRVEQSSDISAILPDVTFIDENGTLFTAVPA